MITFRARSRVTGSARSTCATARAAERTLTFFVSRLEYSRFVVASIVPDQSVETCVRTLAAHYAAMGGIPLLAAFDRPRPIGMRADDDGQVTEWDPALRVRGAPARPRRRGARAPWRGARSRDQSRQLAEAGLLQDRTFADEADAAEKLDEWLRDYNARPQDEVGGKAPAMLLAEERQRLRPLKLQPRDLALRVPVLVGPRAAVVYEGQSYAMPPEAVGLIGVLHLYPDRVDDRGGPLRATHPRRRPSPSYVPPKWMPRSRRRTIAPAPAVPAAPARSRSRRRSPPAARKTLSLSLSRKREREPDQVFLPLPLAGEGRMKASRSRATTRPRPCRPCRGRCRSR